LRIAGRDGVEHAARVIGFGLVFAPLAGCLDMAVGGGLQPKALRQQVAIKRMSAVAME